MADDFTLRRKGRSARRRLRTLEEIDGKDGEFRRAKEAVWRAEHGMAFSWVCIGCGEIHDEWHQTPAADTPPHARSVTLICPVCDTALIAWVPDEWMAWAEVWRPYQRYRAGLDWVAVQQPDLSRRPPPLKTHRLEREMKTQIIYYMLGDNEGEDTPGLLIGEVELRDAPYFPGSKDEHGALVVPFPTDERLQALLLGLHPALAAEHQAEAFEPGHPIEIPNARRGLDRGCWAYKGQRALSAEQEEIISQLAAEHSTPEPTPEAIGLPNPLAPVHVPEPPPLDPILAELQAGAPIGTDAIAEWEIAAETHPGITVEDPLWEEE